jgi:20S proteasome alpha/beta subunit
MLLGSEIEVAVVAKGKKLRKLTNDEVEDRLNSIAEKSEL